MVSRCQIGCLSPYSQTVLCKVLDHLHKLSLEHILKIRLLRGVQMFVDLALLCLAADPVAPSWSSSTHTTRTHPVHNIQNHPNYTTHDEAPAKLNPERLVPDYTPCVHPRVVVGWACRGRIPRHASDVRVIAQGNRMSMGEGGPSICECDQEDIEEPLWYKRHRPMLAKHMPQGFVKTTPVHHLSGKSNTRA